MGWFISLAVWSLWGRRYNRRMSMKLKAGDPLPSVGLRATDGYLLNLRSFVTKQPALFLFFGAPSLTGAGRRRGLKAIGSLVAGHDRLHEAGIAVVGISTDSEEQQTEFVAAHELPFLLFSDERRSAVGLLGIETEADGANVNVVKPVAVVVDRAGLIRTVIDPIEPETLIDQVVRALAEPIPATTGP